MRRDESIELLNKAVGDELQAVHQYMYFHLHQYDKQLDNINRFGGSYLALQSFASPGEEGSGQGA